MAKEKTEVTPGIPSYPVSTYRLQLNDGLVFDDVTRLVPYFAGLR